MSNEFTPDEDKSILDFLAKKSENITEPFEMTSLWREFREVEWSNRSLSSLKKRYSCHLAPQLHTFDRFDIDLKVKIMFATKIPVNKDFLIELQDIADVLEVNDRNVIVNFKKGEMVLTSEHFKNSKKWTNRQRNSLIEDEEQEEEEQDICLFRTNNKNDKISLNSETLEIDQSSSQSSTSITTKKMLKFMLNLINFIDSPRLDMIQQQIESALMENNIKHPIPLCSLQSSMESILGMALPDHLVDNETDHTSLSFLLKFIRSTLISWKIPELDDFLMKIELAIGEVGEKKIAIQKIHVALEMGFLSIHHLD